ncbi:hypothetical protein SteCoe_17142 [Stentor coeruleus]|uniref:Cyclic nucleotide-binding domain-containing protein n=1 Tax=Stentor coeruleus TaxID=5963 RepID=A0A1R2BZQ7_9CILI|nr:hypothetical protein SteCoe_17142 [Stentor coeruleus]
MSYSKQNSLTKPQLKYLALEPTKRKRRSSTMPPVCIKVIPINDDKNALINNTDQETGRFIRQIPVVGSKYIDVWKRVKIKIRAELVIKKLMQYDSSKIDQKTNEQNSLTTRKISQTFETGIKELNYLEPIPWYILHPKSTFKSIWNVIIAILLIYTVTLMPFAMSFINSQPWDVWEILDLITDGLFFIDFLIICFSAYYDKSETLISSHKSIMLNYMKTWMFIDFISFFPFSLFDNSKTPSQTTTSNYNNLIRIIRLPKLYRLFRISRLVKLLKHYSKIEIIESIQEYFSIKNSAMRLIKSFFIILLCLHLAACFWHFTSRIDNFTPDTWVARFNYLDTDIGTRYLASIYWAFTTLCTVGYGDISGFTNLERIICISWMICSLYFFSFTIGSLSSMMSSIDTKENVLLSKFAVIDEFSVEANLNKELRNKLKHALRYSADKRGFSWLDKLSIFNELPKQLRYEVAINMHHGAAKDISFFNDKDQSIIASIVPLLQPMYLERNDYVYKKGEFADEIYFIVRGRVSYVFGKEDTVLKSMQKGSYFGDIEVVKGISRKYSAKGIRSSELLIMHRQVMQEVIDEHSNVWQEIRDVALEREKLNEKAIIEIQELIRLRNNGELEEINVKVFKKKVEDLYEKRCQHIQKKQQIFTLKDLSDKIDDLAVFIREGDTPINANRFSLREEDLD